MVAFKQNSNISSLQNGIVAKGEIIQMAPADDAILKPLPIQRVFKNRQAQAEGTATPPQVYPEDLDTGQPKSMLWASTNALRQFSFWEDNNPAMNASLLVRDIVKRIEKSMGETSAKDAQTDDPAAVNVSTITSTAPLDQARRESISIAEEIDISKSHLGIDTCVFWHMLYHAVDGMLKPSIPPGEGAAYRTLSMALIKTCPMLAFDHLPPRFLAQPCKASDKHNVKGEKSAFYLAIENGSNELVTFMIQECLKFIQNDIERSKLDKQSLLQDEDVSDPKEYLVAILQEPHSNIKALQDAINNYIKSNNQEYLLIIDTLLTFDADSTGKGGRLADSNTLKKAMNQTLATFDTFKGNVDGLTNETLKKALCDTWCCEAPSLPVVRTILYHRGDLKKRDSIMEVLKASTETHDQSIRVISPDRRKQLGKAKPESIELFSVISQNSIAGSVAREAVGMRKARLVEIYSTGAEDQIDIEVAKFIINQNYTNVWRLAPVQRAVARLVTDRKNARNLFHAAIDPIRKLCFAESLEPYIEPILDFELLCEIVKCGRLEVWELPCIKKSWKELKDKDKDISMLHTAVEYQKIDFVKHFLREEPGSVTKAVQVRDLDKKKYPLWHNNNAFNTNSKSFESRKPPSRSSSSTASANQSSKNPRGSPLAEQGDPLVADLEPARDATSGPTDTNTEIRNLLVHATIENADGMKTIAKVFRESERQYLPL